jgi:hypothetical protein
MRGKKSTSFLFLSLLKIQKIRVKKFSSEENQGKKKVNHGGAGG